MASAIYNSFKKKIVDGSNINLSADTIKAALVTSAYTPNIDTHANFSDITNEVVGTGYTAGGMSLANKSLTIDTVNDKAVFDADDTSWPTSTITARGVILYKSTGVASTSPLIAYIDLVTDKSTTGDTFYLTWASAGILNLT